MSLRVFNQKYFEPGSMWLMIIGIVCLCQPWVAVLHAYSVAIMLIGLVGFNIGAHIPPPVDRLDQDMASGETTNEGHGHG